MNTNETVILSRKQVASLLSVNECIAAVEGVFSLYGRGETSPPGILAIHATNGGFHIKAGSLDLGRTYFVAKTNANFPDNPKLHSLPTIQGVIAVFDGDNGRLLSLMDSIEITILRTGAATAVAAKYLARENSNTITICGCGNQGRISLRSLAELFTFEKVFAFDTNEQAAITFAREMSEALAISVEPVTDVSKAVRQSDICITCTPAKEPFLRSADISPGTFIAAVGADSQNKQELESEILTKGKLIVDVMEQCATIGELHHAIRNNVLSYNNVHAELGEIISKRKPGRQSNNEIIVFDSTGMALQDVAAAVIVYEKAVEQKMGLLLNFAN